LLVQGLTYKTDQPVALAKMMQGAALEFKAALKRERDANKSAADLRLSQMRGSLDDDDAAGMGALAPSGGSRFGGSDHSSSSGGSRFGGSDHSGASSTASSPVSVESRDTDEGTDSEDGDDTTPSHGAAATRGGGASDEDASSDLSVDLDALEAELDAEMGAE
jgi:hypothetical protein